MKVILETANELLEAFDNLPNNEKTEFSPLDFFGLWQGQDINAKKLRSDAWNNRI